MMKNPGQYLWLIPCGLVSVVADNTAGFLRAGLLGFLVATAVILGREFPKTRRLR